ncbi:MAG: ABC transporter ATP-binding protein [Myxococcales bacterium]|nr:ABC transporter ATP-binding protein [Myxococcales bacterium]
MKAVEVRNLTKDYQIYSRRGQKFKELLTLNNRRYHEIKRALDDVNFTVEKGECLGVIGDNGSGKSTLLKILARTSFPTAGEIEIDGEVSYILDPATGFNPEFSGRQNVFTKCALLGLTTAQTEALFPVIHEFSGLGDRIDHPIKTYSTGMTVRLGFSVAIHVPFDVLLVDEVLSVGDYLFQRKCISAIRVFKDTEKTIIVSSHNLSEVAAFCDRILLLQEGRIGRLGRTEDVVAAYVRECNERYSRVDAAPLPVNDRELNGCAERLGKVTILDVAFLDGDGRETDTFQCGAPLTVRVRFSADEEIDNPCLRLQFLRNDGLLAAGTNTYRHDLNYGRMLGRYEARCTFPEMNLLKGEYYANIGIWPDEYQSFLVKTPYDIRQFLHVIKMESSRLDGGGIVRLVNRWELDKLDES